ncbi:MAG: RNA polymerase sigma factor [candidate division WOR-3 bacterium]
MDNEPPDSELVRRAKSKELTAFEELIKRHSQALFAFMYRILGDSAEAEELTQETWVRAWKGLGNFKERSEFKTWLFRIGMNLALNLKTRRKVTEELTEFLPGEEKKEPARVYQQTQKEKVIRDALAQLPVDQRTAIVLLIYERMRYKEIAEVMGKSVRAVDSLLVRAKRRLKELLLPAREKGVI